MPEKKSKYDTDPLDPDFARQTEEMWGATRLVDPVTRPTDDQQPPPQRYHPESEAPTRRIDDTFAQSYPSVFAPPPAYQPPPAARPAYQQPPPVAPQPPPAPPPYQQPYQQPPYAPRAAGPAFDAQGRTVAGLGIPERYAIALPYAPFYIGLVASIIELLVAPRAEGRARFHAAQGMALQLAILAVNFALGVFSSIGGVRVGTVLFSLASIAFLVYSMIRVWNGHEHRLAPLDEPTRFLNERIDPRK